MQDYRPSIRSTWKDPIGKVLSNVRIAFYQRAGRYGEEAKMKALASVVRNGQVRYCIGEGPCGAFINVRYLRWSYLPTPGYYCPRCVEHYRTERDKDNNLRNRIREYV